MFRIDFLTLFAAFGSFQGILFSLILWFRKKSKLADKIFSLLLLATSVRIAKNIVVHIRFIDPDLEMSQTTWRLLINIGILHQFAIGPLFLLYFLARTRQKFKFRKIHLLHFIPYFILLILSPTIEWPFWQSIGLWASYISILAYYVIAVWVYRKASRTESDPGLKWLKTILIITGILLLVYSPALFKYVGYLGGSVLYAIGVYFVSIIVLGRDRFFSYFQKKYPGSSIKSHQSKALVKLLEKKMQVENIYLDSQLSLTKLAKELHISPNALSQLINTQFQKSFTDYINEYRIETAKAYLSDPEKDKTKIIAIAFECGFNSLSTFNTVFKKIVGVPPNQYRKDHS